MITTIKARAHTQVHANTSQKNTRPPCPECGGSGQSRCGRTCFAAAPVEASCFQVCMSASTASITLAVTVRCRHCPLSSWSFMWMIFYFCTMLVFVGSWSFILLRYFQKLHLHLTYQSSCVPNFLNWIFWIKMFFSSSRYVSYLGIFY